MDGGAGLIVSVLNSYYVFLKLAKLWELQHGPAVALRIDSPRRSIAIRSSGRPEPISG